MGKVKTRFIGVEEIEEKQKSQQKLRSEEKKREKAPGKQKSKEEVALNVAEKKNQEKLEKTKELIESQPEEKKEEKKVKKAEPRKRGKNYLLAKKNVDQKKEYALADGLKILKKMKFAKFDESVELHINVDKTGIRGEIQMPHTTGKTVNVKIFDDKLLDQIEQGKIDFDVLVARPSDMPKIAKVARVLGPKGLMPNPKTGTVSDKPEEVVKKLTSGALRWKTEPKAPLVHQMVGKISAPEKELEANVKAFIKGLPKNSVQAAFIKTTMSPSVRLNLQSL